MATKTINITSYSSLTLTYSIAQTDTKTTVTFTNWSFKNTRSSGMAYKCDLTVSFASGSLDEGAQMGADELTLASNLPVGTKSRSGTFSSAWARYTKYHSAEAQDISCYAGLESSSDYWDGEATVKFTVPAKTSYKVTLNANGGTGGTASLTKWHDETLYLGGDFIAPTRAGWKFLGWNTSSTATAAQSTYTANEAAPLYAVWARHITGIKLSVTTLRVADGTSTAGADEGEWCYGTCDYTVTGAAAGDLSLDVSVSPTGPAIQTSSFAMTKQVDQTLTGTIVFRASGCSTESDYSFTVDASCSNKSATQTAVTKSLTDVLTAAYFPFDILGDAYWDYENQTGERPGHGVAFGLPCVKEGFAVGMDLFFRQWAGIIQMFAGSTPPAGWLLCDGSAVSRTTYAALFAAVGTTWGAGDGSTTFNLPDLRGRAPIGAGAGSGLTARTLGGKVGAESVTLNAAQSGLRAHTHGFTQPTITPKYSGASGYLAAAAYKNNTAEHTYFYENTSGGRQYAASGGAVGAVTGGAQDATSAHNNMQPSAVVNFIIHTGKTD